MSFLAPLYALGLLAIIGPILFHLIRRAPKGQVAFSSLMFLSPSPPRLTKRSRLDNILLLLLRALALGLLAFAFMRPFLRSEMVQEIDDRQRSTTILLDVSASMKRGDLWQRAINQVEEIIEQAKPTDELSLLIFDSSLRPILEKEESSQLEQTARRSLIRQRLAELKPTWAATDLGQALSETLHKIEDRQSSASLHRIVLVSDLQQGSRLEALQAVQWPTDVKLELRTVTDGGGNAGLNRLTNRFIDSEESNLRIRVFTDPECAAKQFSLSWADDSPIAEFEVPAGTSRVVPVKLPQPPQRVLTLQGDSQTFDNALYIANAADRESTVYYVGADKPEDATRPRYYLERVLGNTPGRTVTVKPFADAESNWLRAPMIVVTGEADEAQQPRLRKYLNEGGTVLVVVTQPGLFTTLATLADVPVWEIAEAQGRDYAMIQEVDFAHPIFAPLAGPKYGDFTKVMFWHHRRITPDQLGHAEAIAKFDNGDPALLEKAVGQGTLLVLTSGWQPSDSQLARSSKFFPLMSTILERRTGRRPTTANFIVGERVPIPSTRGMNQYVIVRTPDNRNVESNSEWFTQTDLPGIYRIESSIGVEEFAVNLDPDESRTSPLAIETLEQFGCRLSDAGRETIEIDRQRQKHETELENSQKFWQWLILAAFVILLIETCLAGRLSRSRSITSESGTP